MFEANFYFVFFSLFSVQIYTVDFEPQKRPILIVKQQHLDTIDKKLDSGLKGLLTETRIVCF